MLEIVEERYRDYMAKRITKAMRNYMGIKRAKGRQIRELKRLMEEKTRLAREKQLKQDNKVFSLNNMLNAIDDFMQSDIVQDAKNALATAVDDFMHPKELVTEFERARIINAVIKYQALSIKQEGIDALYLTAGTAGAMTFATQQELARKKRDPYYTVLPKDLSGEKREEIYLWYKEGKGYDVVTNITVIPKPPGCSRYRMADIYTSLRKKGIWLAWTETVDFLVEGHQTLSIGKGGVAVRRVEVASNAREEEELRAAGLYCAGDLRDFGYNTRYCLCYVQ